MSAYQKSGTPFLYDEGTDDIVGIRDKDGGERLFDLESLSNYTALRAYNGPSKSAYITGYLVTAAPAGIAGPFTRDDADTTSADNGGTIIVANNGRRWKRVYSGDVAAVWFGVVPGAGNNTAALQAAVTTALASANRSLLLPPGVINTTGLQVPGRNLTMKGSFQARYDGATNTGTQLTFIGNSGSLIQLGEDDGQPWSDALYDGPQGLMLEDMALMCSSPNRTTPLALAGNYAAGCYGIRDWRGGDVKLRNVTIEGFEYNFWGINSDFNTFYNVTSLYSKYGIYAGPRSDQFTINDLYSFYCDRAVTVDGATGVRLNHPNIVICGSTTEAPINIRRGSGIVTIHDPWFENFSGLANQLAFVEAGTEDGYGANTNYQTGVVIDNPLIGTGNPGGAGSTKYLVVLGNARNVVINNPTAANGLSLTSNLLYLAAFATGIDHSTSNSLLRVRAAGAWHGKLYTNLGTGTPSAFYESADSANVVGSATGRFVIRRWGAAVGAEELRISTEGAAGQVNINLPTYTGGQTSRLNLTRAIQHRGSPPGTGTYEAGDYVPNTAPFRFLGWVCVTGGTPGTWEQAGEIVGPGGVVAQATNKSTGVTLNTRTGQIAMEATTSIAAGAVASFTLTNSNIGVDDVVHVHRKSGGSAGSYRVWCDSVAAGSCVVCVENRTAGSLSEAVVLQFRVLAGATS